MTANSPILYDNSNDALCITKQHLMASNNLHDEPQTVTVHK